MEKWIVSSLYIAIKATSYCWLGNYDIEWQPLVCSYHLAEGGFTSKISLYFIEMLNLADEESEVGMKSRQDFFFDNTDLPKLIAT